MEWLFYKWKYVLNFDKGVSIFTIIVIFKT